MNSTFRYVARTSAGQIRRGFESSSSAESCVAQLRSRQWTVIDVKESSQPAQGIDLAGILSPNRWLPIRSLDVETSLSQLAVMLGAGLSLLNALGTVEEQTPRLAMRRVWQDVSRRIRAGHSLSESMARHRCFSHLVIQLVAIGEQTGNLESVLKHSAEAMERRRDVQAKFLTALMYPALVLVAAISVTGFMILYVIPQMERFLSQIGRRLPWMTQSLLDVSAWIRAHFAQGAALAALCVIALVAILATKRGRLMIHYSMLRMPILGGLFRCGGCALAARSLYILLSSGVTILASLQTIEKMFRNEWHATAIRKAREEIMHGGTLSDGIRLPYAFLPMLSSMAAVGERSGTLDEVMADTARFHEEQLDRSIRRFSALFEPVVILVVGSIVGYVYIAFFLALFAAAGSN